MAVTGQAFNVVKMSAVADAIGGTLSVATMRWVGATTAGHSLSVTDTAGNVLWESEADGANFIDVHPFYMRGVRGITVATMQSGSLYVYLM